MSREDVFSPVLRSLDQVAGAGETIGFWLRDDDAVDVTTNLRRLADGCGDAGLPVLLAVIPASADERLGPFVAGARDLVPCQHGWQHRNHAGPGQRACEIGGGRPAEVVLHDLAQGRRKLQALFGDRLADVLVPPWNRIDPALIPSLRDLGFTALSTFGPVPDEDPCLRRINCDVDIIDWRNGRTGRSFGDVANKVAEACAAAHRQGRPVGLLTHHLVHDPQAWSVLDTLLGCLARHPGAKFVGAV